MPRSGVALSLMGLLGLVLGGCMQSTLQPSSNASLTARDRQLLAHPPYAQATIPRPIAGTLSTTRAKSRRARSWSIPTRVILLRPAGRQGDPLRRDGGEEAMAWSGVATVGRTAEWPD